MFIKKWQEKYYGLKLEQQLEWSLNCSEDMLTWEEIYYFEREFPPKKFRLEVYNNYLFFPSFANVWFFDGKDVGNGSEELGFPNGNGDNGIQTIKATNNGLLIAFERDDFYYQIVDFSRTPIIVPPTPLPIIILEPIIHVTDSLIITVDLPPEEVQLNFNSSSSNDFDSPSEQASNPQLKFEASHQINLEFYISPPVFAD